MWEWKWFNGFSPDGYRPTELFVLMKDGQEVGPYFEADRKKVIDDLVRHIKNGGSLNTRAKKINKI